MTILKLVGGRDFKTAAPTLRDLTFPLFGAAPAKQQSQQQSTKTQTREDIAEEDTVRRHVMAQQLDGISVRELINEINECSQPYAHGTEVLRRHFFIQQLLQKVGIAAMLSPDDFYESPICSTVIEPKKLLKAFPSLKKTQAGLLGLALY